MKKILSIFLALVMLSGIISTGFVGVSATEAEIPEGYTPIYDIEDLYGVRNNLSGNYILMADIDMTEDTAAGGDWDVNGEGWSPIGTYSDNPFSGIFNGNNHSIIGMIIKKKSRTNSYIGLFGYVTGTINNLKIVNATIKCVASGTAASNVRIGTLSAYIDGATIENIAVINTDIQGKDASYDFHDHYTGGIIGYAVNSSIKNSYVSGRVTKNGANGEFSGWPKTYVANAGIAAGVVSSTIENCYNLASITGRYSNNGGIIDTASNITIRNCINIGTTTNGIGANGVNCYYVTANSTYTSSTAIGITAAQLKSEVALAKLDFENTWFIDTASGVEHPQLQSNPEVDAKSITIKTMPKQQFMHNDEFDCTGLTVAIEYENGTTSERKLKASAVSGYDMSVTGKQTVTVKYLSAETTYDIYVSERPVDDIELDNSDVVMDIGTTKTIAVTYTPSNATNKTVAWTSDDESVATVDENGTVTAVGRGSAVITATTSNGISKSCYIEVLVPATEISFAQSQVVMQPKETYELELIINPENTTDTISWSSSDEKVATVDENGIVTAVGTGNATIVAQTSRNVFASCSIQVKIPATSVTIEETAEVNVGEKITLTATMTPADTTDTITWKSSDSSVASVSSSGVVTGKKIGTTIITATTTSGIVAECVVTVLKPSTSIKLDKTSVTINKGDSEALIATVIPADSTDNVTWTSSDETVAVVNNGVVTATGRGMAIITAKTDAGFSVTCVVKVLVPASDISFDETIVNIVEGSIRKLNVTTKPEDTTDEISWTSSKSDVVSVTSDGTVFALSYGEAIITATTSSGKTAMCKVIVNHDYTSAVTPPACTEQGFTAYTCTVCKDSYTDDFVDATGHIDGEWAFENKESSDSLIKRCEICQITVEEKPLSEKDVAVLLKTSEGNVVDAVITETGETIYFENIENGEYVITVLKTDYVARKNNVTVSDNCVVYETEKLNKSGDITGDGKVNTIDVARANSHAKGVTTLADYDFSCADVTGDRKVNTIDVARINSHAKGVTKLW